MSCYKTTGASSDRVHGLTCETMLPPREVERLASVMPPMSAEQMRWCRMVCRAVSCELRRREERMHLRLVDRAVGLAVALAAASVPYAMMLGACL